MTNPAGRSFLSYKRDRRAEAELLISAQHDLGIPTWRDLDDLDEVPTEDEIKRILRDPETANSILWLTPEIASSPMVRKVEAPLILERARRGDAFFVVPVVAGGLDYEEAADLLDPSVTLEDLKQWNLRKVMANPIDPASAVEIAARVLRRRVAAIHRSLPEGEPLRVALHTRKAPPDSRASLILHWLHRFEGREAKAGAWREHLLPALRMVTKAIEEKAPGRPVEATGLAALPAAIALGSEFLAPRRLPIVWEQYRQGRELQAWSLAVPREPSGFQPRCEPRELTARDLAVLVSVTDHVEPVFAATRGDLPAFRAILRIWKPGDPPHDLENAGQAADLADLIQREVRKAVGEYPEIVCVHLFMAVPAGLAMMIGQLLNNVNAVQTYEMVSTDSGKRHRPAALLHPAG
jgi:SMODS-associated and fused to various effectors sensor domain